MARAPRNAALAEIPTESAELLTSEQVTYVPGPEGPMETKWMGIVFRANAPKMVTKRALIEAAKKNPFFKVGPFDPRTDVYREHEPAPPKTSREYRAHCVRWLLKTDSLDELAERWRDEAQLRADCEVGSDDLDYLSSLFDPKIADLIRREDEPAEKRRQIVKRGDFADLSLQIGQVGQNVLVDE